MGRATPMYNETLLAYNVLKVSQQGTFKFMNPKHEHKTECQSWSDQVNSLSLNFLDYLAKISFDCIIVRKTKS